MLRNISATWVINNEYWNCPVWKYIHLFIIILNSTKKFLQVPTKNLQRKNSNINSQCRLFVAYILFVFEENEKILKLMLDIKSIWVKSFKYNFIKSVRKSFLWTSSIGKSLNFILLRLSSHHKRFCSVNECSIYFIFNFIRFLSFYIHVFCVSTWKIYWSIIIISYSRRTYFKEIKWNSVRNKSKFPFE